jgi:hypothetical protein
VNLNTFESESVVAPRGVPVTVLAGFLAASKIDKLTIAIDRPKLAAEDEKKLMEAQRSNKVSE